MGLVFEETLVLEYLVGIQGEARSHIEGHKDGTRKGVVTQIY